MELQRAAEEEERKAAIFGLLLQTQAAKIVQVSLLNVALKTEIENGSRCSTGSLIFKACTQPKTKLYNYIGAHHQVQVGVR
jgi:hypothetical protein